MTSMEMHSFSSSDIQPLVDNPIPEMNSERVDTAYGKVKVSIYGNRDRHPLITFHDLGLDSESNFQNFFQFVSIAEFTEKFCVYNINAPGQEVDAQTLPDTYEYPSMDGLAKIVEDVVNHFELQSLLNQRRLDALILVSCVATTAGWIEWGYQKMNIRYLRNTGVNSFTVDYLMWHHFGRRLDECSSDIVRQYRIYFQHLSNPKNLAMFIESYMNRTAIPISRDGQSGPMLTVPVLQIVGAGSPFVNDTVDVNTKLDPSRSDWIKVSGACGLVLDDRPEIVTEIPTMNVVKLMKKIQDTQNGSCFAVTDKVDEC